MFYSLISLLPKEFCFINIVKIVLLNGVVNSFYSGLRINNVQYRFSNTIYLFFTMFYLNHFRDTVSCMLFMLNTDYFTHDIFIFHTYYL